MLNLGFLPCIDFSLIRTEISTVLNGWTRVRPQWPQLRKKSISSYFVYTSARNDGFICTVCQSLSKPSVCCKF